MLGKTQGQEITNIKQCCTCASLMSVDDAWTQQGSNDKAQMLKKDTIEPSMCMNLTELLLKNHTSGFAQSNCSFYCSPKHTASFQGLPTQALMFTVLSCLGLAC